MRNESVRAGEHESLIADLGWIRHVARELVRDSHRADDLAQDACVVALSHGPSDPRSLRGWLTAVMANLVRQEGRGARRRKAREEIAARAEHVDATDELVARASVQRRIVDAVLRLEEPYRSTVLLRYFEALPPREIARRQDVPIATVKSRLKRGLARLREQLDDGRGRSGAWLALAFPLAWRSRAPLASTLGGLIVNTKVTLAVVSVAVLATALAIVQFSGTNDSRAPRLPDVKAEISADVEATHAALDMAGEPAQRVELAQAETAATSTSALRDAVAPAMHRLRGRVLSSDGSPLAGIALEFESGDSRTAVQSGAGGAFELETEGTQGIVAAKDARFATVFEAAWNANSRIEPLVIVAPAIDLGGAVVDPAGQPVQGARVSLATPNGFGLSLGRSLEATRVVEWSSRTDSSGAFTMSKIPQVSGASLRVLVDGYEPAIQLQPEFSDLHLLFQLRRPTVLAKGALRGRVIDNAGQPAANARVAAGCASTMTDEQGEFALDLSRAVTADAVTAVKPGFRPVRMERPNEPTDARAVGGSTGVSATGWPDFIELRLGGPPLSITGRVVDPDDKPRANVGVWLADPTLFGLIGRMPVQSESLVAGAAIPAHALEPDPNLPSEDGDLLSIYRNVGGESNAIWNYVVTDASGRFEIGGLDDREYRLRTFDTKTLQNFTTKPIHAGDNDVEIEVPAPAVYEKLAGRVVTIGDRPVQGARVHLRAKCFHVETRFFGGTQEVDMLMPGIDATTDEDGRFSFDRVPKEHVYLAISADGILPTDWTIPEGADPANLVAFVDSRCRLEVRVEPPFDRADEVAIRDGDDKLLQIIQANSVRTRYGLTVPLEEGRSGILSVRSSARTLQLKKNGQVVESHPITLAPGEINVVEL
jgi:RNA polymerase sigma-70 factor (ECF subfamily)